MKFREQFYGFGIELTLVGFWVLSFVSDQDFLLKYVLFFILAGLLPIISKFFPSKFNVIIQPGLVLAFLLLFPMISNHRLTLLGGTVEWNIILLFIGSVFLTISKWKLSTSYFPNNLLFKSLLFSGIGLVCIGIILFIVLMRVYELNLNIILFLVRSLAIYFLLGLLSFQATLDKKRCFRLGIVVFVFSVMMIF